MDDMTPYHVTSTNIKAAVPGAWLLATTVAVVGLCVVSFYGGMLYRSKHPIGTGTAAASMYGGFGSKGLGGSNSTRVRHGGLATVTAASTSSITVKNQRTGASTTYAIDNSTQIMKDGAVLTASSIQAGDTVIIRPSAISATTAGSIVVDPSFTPSGTTPSSSSQKDNSGATTGQSV